LSPAAAALAAPIQGPREKILRLHGSAFVADVAGVLYWPDEHLLIVADLHLEKGSSYAARRVFLPPYDTSATLARLAAAIARFAPKRVVALGDSFHDRTGAGRLLAHDVQALRAMQTGRDWLWIAGNHDPAPQSGLDGDHAAGLTIGAIRLRHEPSLSPCDGEIAGHLHPVALVGGRGSATRRRCFVTDGLRCILPAFGAYAGGLNFLDPACGGLFAGGEHHAHVLGRDAVYTVGRHQCLIERSGDPARR
jgi:DNA ligase-associated metallophosphoesterase